MRSQLIVLLGLACLALAAPSQFMNDDFLKEGDRLILFTPEIDPVWLSSVRAISQKNEKRIKRTLEKLEWKVKSTKKKKIEN